MLLDVLGRDFKVLVAESGESALEQLQYVRPDIVLLDVLMSGMDGFDTFRHIRRLPEFIHTPVLFLSGLDDIDHKLRGLHLGAVDYITKPFHPEEVLARVESQCRVHSHERRLQSINQNLGAEVTLQKQIQEELEKRIKVGIIVAVKRDAWTIHFKTDSAKRLFNKYYGLELKESLPDPFAQEIDRSTRDFWEGQIRQTKLQISFYQINELSVLITLEEIDTVPSRSPDALLVLGLTPREAEVLFWIAEGKTSPEIALILNAAATTIKKHVNHILEKLALENRLSAALLANEILRSSESG
jgi:DNA-binding NarL/FixJ family response regulator